MKHLLAATSNLIKLPQTKMWLNYDAEADVLYIRFTEKPLSNQGDVQDNGMILDYSDNDLVGMTVLEASQC